MKTRLCLAPLECSKKTSIKVIVTTRLHKWYRVWQLPHQAMRAAQWEWQSWSCTLLSMYQCVIFSYIHGCMKLNLASVVHRNIRLPLLDCEKKIAQQKFAATCMTANITNSWQLAQQLAGAASQLWTCFLQIHCSRTFEACIEMCLCNAGQPERESKNNAYALYSIKPGFSLKQRLFSKFKMGKLWRKRLASYNQKT